jgi:hypothetical protein
MMSSSDPAHSSDKDGLMPAILGGTEIGTV